MVATVSQHAHDLICDECGFAMLDKDGGARDEHAAHVAECDGLTGPRERFEVGARVEYSDFGRLRLDVDPREGEVIGFSRKYGHCVRVVWDGTTTPRRFAHRFIKHTDSQ